MVIFVIAIDLEVVYVLFWVKDKASLLAAWKLYRDELWQCYCLDAHFLRRLCSLALSSAETHTHAHSEIRSHSSSPPFHSPLPYTFSLLHSLILHTPSQTFTHKRLVLRSKKFVIGSSCLTLMTSQSLSHARVVMLNCKEGGIATQLEVPMNR